MRLSKFKVTSYRNAIDTDWIDVTKVTAFVGQNEAGKSNLFDALFRLNPYTDEDGYREEEDWPMDDWVGRKNAEGSTVCSAKFALEPEETAQLIDETAAAVDNPEDEANKIPAINVPEGAIIVLTRAYGKDTICTVEGVPDGVLNSELVHAWGMENAPKFVLIADYGLSNTQSELDQLLVRRDANDFSDLHPDEQTMLIVLELAQIDLKQVVEDSKNADGRTNRTLDTIAASTHLSQQFGKLWSQKRVDFDIRIDGATMNIFAKDEGAPMPVRLKRRSTGFRWYTSFAWKFTHASHGEYKNCVLLLEEPGIHLHYSGQRDLIAVFNDLSASNDVLYTTHLSSMVDHENPERVRIVEERNHHVVVSHGVVSTQQAPMAVIETSLGLSPDLSGMLGNRKVLIVEGGIDHLILRKLSGLLKVDGQTGLSDQIYLWPAQGASKTPMYAAFAIGQKWDAALLLDSDEAGEMAKAKIKKHYLADVAEEEGTTFPILMLGNAAGITKTDSEIEDLFPDDFFRECVNATYSTAIADDALPVDGSTAIVDRVRRVLSAEFNRDLDKKRVLAEILRRFDEWTSAKQLPLGTADKAAKLFKAINAAFALKE